MQKRNTENKTNPQKNQAHQINLNQQPASWNLE